jgi:N-acetyl sugar amidotransferase
VIKLNRNLIELYGLPKEILFCKKCTISNQRPRISFDENGVCSACNYAEYKESIDWNNRELELVKLLDRFRRDDGGYEVLVPSSGGKDSVFVAHELQTKYKMKVLTVTWSPHIYTQIGWENFQNMIQIGNLDNILGTPRGDIHRKLTRIAFKELGDPFQPFIYGQTNFPLQIAAKYRIPLIMYGENGEVEYGGSMKNAFKPNRSYKDDHNLHYFSNFPPEAMVQHGINESDLKYYLPPSHEDLDSIGAEIHFYGYYKRWIPQENFYYAVNNTGFRPLDSRNEGTYSKYASLDDKLDGFHYYMAYVKFGIGRTTSDTAHEIRDNHITRDEGVGLVKKYDGEFPSKYFKEFLEYCSLTEEEFESIVNSWRSDHLWKKTVQGWKLRHTVDGSGTDD